MNRNYGMEIVRATEIAALHAARHLGSGEPLTVLNQAREGMIRTLKRIDVYGNIKDDPFTNRPEVYQVPPYLGSGEFKMDFILNAAEGYEVGASGGANVTSFIAMAEEGGFPLLPDLPMFRISVPPEAADVIDLHETPTINIKRVARALKKYTENLIVCIIGREEHRELIEEVRSCKSSMRILEDGEISAALSTVIGRKADMVMGYGSARDSVMIAAAMKCYGGGMSGKFINPDADAKEMIRNAGFANPDAVFTVDSLVRTQEVTFAATGITDGAFLEGVRFMSDGAVTNSCVSRGETKTSRYISTRHYFDFKPVY